jgi:hypothetical protein
MQLTSNYCRGQENVDLHMHSPICLQGVVKHMDNCTLLYLTLFLIILSGVGLSLLGTAATTGLLYQPQMIDDGDCGAISGMKICRGNRNTRRKPAPVTLRPPQMPYDQTRARTQAAVVGSRRLTA